MAELRMIAISSELAAKVRVTMMSPGWGHPASAAVAKGHGPCRHCLQPFVVGEDVRILFTLNMFEGMDAIPQPGPVFVHECVCERYEEDGGFPEKLLQFGSVLDGYDDRQIVRRRERVSDCSQQSMLEEMMSDPLIQYVMVRDAKAGCYDFRVERQEG